MQMRNTNITSVTAHGTDSTIIYAKDSADLLFKDFVRFEGNLADEGGAVRLTHASRLFAQNTTFLNNVARTRAGAIIALDESSINLNKCNFTHNEAPRAAAIVIENVALQASLVEASHFEENRAT